jgi:hypothetical protein
MLASLSIPVSEKLTRENFRLWCAQVVPAIRAAQREGFIEGTERVPVKTLRGRERLQQSADSKSGLHHLRCA